MNHKQSHPKIQALVNRWYSLAPFLCEFLLRANYIEDTTERVYKTKDGDEHKEEMTIGVRVKNYKLEFVYNPAWLDKLTEARDTNPGEIEGVMVHEILHVLKNDIARKGKNFHKLWNIATDMINNEEIISKWKILGQQVILPSQGCFMSQLKTDTGYDGPVLPELVYQKLLENTKFVYTTMDDHSMLEDSDPHEVSIVRRMLIDNATKKGWGKMSGEMQTYIKELIRPEGIPLEKILRNKLEQTISGYVKQSSWQRFNRRGFDYLPGRVKRSQKVNVVVDTSGSCYDEKTISKFFSEVDRISEKVNITLYQVDTKVNSVEQYTRGMWRNIKVKGGGGTIFQPLFDQLKNEHRTHESLVIFTDGEFDWNLNKYGTKPLWVINNSNFSKTGEDIIVLKKDTWRNQA